MAFVFCFVHSFHQFPLHHLPTISRIHDDRRQGNDRRQTNKEEEEEAEECKKSGEGEGIKAISTQAAKAADILANILEQQQQTPSATTHYISEALQLVKFLT